MDGRAKKFVCERTDGGGGFYSERRFFHLCFQGIPPSRRFVGVYSNGKAESRDEHLSIARMHVAGPATTPALSASILAQAFDDFEPACYHLPTSSLKLVGSSRAVAAFSHVFLAFVRLEVIPTVCCVRACVSLCTFWNRWDGGVMK